MGRPNKRREWFRKNTHKSKSRLLTCVLDNVHTESMLVFAAPRIEHDDNNNNNDDNNNDDTNNDDTNNDDTNNDDTMENTKEEYNNQTKGEEQEQQEEKNVEEMKEEKDDDNDNDNDDVEADNNNEKRKENEMSSTETGIGAGTSSSHSDERDSKKIKLDHESQIQVPAPVELSSKKKKRKKRKKHLRPLIVTTSKLQLPQQPQQQQKDIQDENQFQSHSISQSLVSPNSDTQSKSQLQLQSTNSIQSPIFPKLLSPEEAMENKDKSIQIQIHIKPLLVLDINGILCHRIRESGCDIPSSLLSHLLQLDDLDLQRKKMNVNTNNSVSVDTNDNTIGDNNNIDNTIGDNNNDNDNTNGDNNNDNEKTNPDTTINSLPTSFGKETERERIKRVCRSIYRETIGHVAGTPIVARTDLNNLLTFLDEHFTLSIWSSAKKKTVNQLVNLLLPDDIADRLLFVWGQNQCECINGSKKESVKKDNDNNDHNKGANDGHNKGTNDDSNKGANDDKDESQNMNNETNPSSSTTTANTTTTSVHRKPHYCNLIFVKHISKVWAQYPLWNAHNTLLIDDSPEKCPEKYQNNTVHPPPILGLDKTVLLSKLMKEEGCNDDGNNSDNSFHHSAFLDDVNERKQVDFFQKLANIYNNNDKKANDVEMKKNLLDFLTVSGRGHMSWRG